MTSSLSSEFLAEIRHLAEQGDWKSVAEACAGRGGGSTDATYLEALAAYARNDLALAARLARQVLDSGVEFAECSDLIAIIHCLAGDLNTALYYAKLSVSLPAREDLHPFRPKELPDFATALKAAEEKPILARAKEMLGSGRLDVAENLLHQHLAFFPADDEAMLLVGICLSLLRNHFETVDWYRGCIHRLPSHAGLLSALAMELAECGQFTEARVAHERASRLAPSDALIQARLVTDLADDCHTAPEDVARLSARWGETFAVQRRDGFTDHRPGEGQISVGFLLADLPGSPAGCFFADMLRRADPTQFKLVGYGYGELSDLTNMDFQKSVYEWYDLTGLDSETIADMLAAENLDIVIDTAGFAAPLPLAALGAGSVPRQVLWRYAPYAGLPTDAILCDDVIDAAGEALLPPDCRRLRLPHGSVLAALPSTDVPMVNLREGEGVVFGADAALRQLTPETAAWWAELLLAVPKSTLVLRDHGFRRPQALSRLSSLFGDFGVMHRIDLVAEEDDIAFWSQADIAVMPPLAASAQHALNLLWIGMPTLVPLPRGRHGRETASLFHHAGFAGLTAGSIEDFVRVGSGWATDTERRHAFRETVRDWLSSSAVFDPEIRARDLWQACRQLLQ